MVVRLALPHGGYGVDRRVEQSQPFAQSQLLAPPQLLTNPQLLTSSQLLTERDGQSQLLAEPQQFLQSQLLAQSVLLAQSLLFAKTDASGSRVVYFGARPLDTAPRSELADAGSRGRADAWGWLDCPRVWPGAVCQENRLQRCAATGVQGK